MRGVLVAPIAAALLASAGPAPAQSPVPGPCPATLDAERREEARRLYAAGTTSALAEDWAEALPAFEEAGRLDPRSLIAHFARGQGSPP